MLHAETISHPQSATWVVQVSPNSIIRHGFLSLSTPVIEVVDGPVGIQQLHSRPGTRTGCHSTARSRAGIQGFGQAVQHRAFGVGTGVASMIVRPTDVHAAWPSDTAMVPDASAGICLEPFFHRRPVSLRRQWPAYFGRTFFCNQETPASVVDKMA